MPKNAESSFYGSEGFTLIEVMASLAIFGLGVLVIIRLFSGGLGLVKKTEEHTRAALLAREKISATLISYELKEGVSKGTEDGLDWTVEVTPYDEESKDDGRPFKLMKVEVKVGNDESKRGPYRLTSLKAVFKEK